jgi:hypothetical protein
VHAVLADSPWGSSIDVSDCVGDSWKNEKSLMQSNPWAADGLQTHSFYVYCRTLCFFSDLCSGIRCASIIRWCLIFIGQYCVVVVLGVSNAYESDDFGRLPRKLKHPCNGKQDEKASGLVLPRKLNLPGCYSTPE